MKPITGYHTLDIVLNIVDGCSGNVADLGLGFGGDVAKCLAGVEVPINRELSGGSAFNVARCADDLHAGRERGIAILSVILTKGRLDTNHSSA
jgi:hypothetical protein